EQSNVGVRFEETKTTQQNRTAIKINVASFICPSSGLSANRPGGLGYSTYRGVMGAQPITETDPTKTEFSTNGMLFKDSAIKFAEITDGTSNTIIIGDSRYGFWGDGYSCCARFRSDRKDFDSYWVDPNYGPPTNNRLQFFSFGSM